MSADEDTITALNYKTNTRFGPDELPTDLENSEYISQGRRSRLVCPEGECSARAKVEDLPDGKAIVCEDFHTHDYHPRFDTYYEIDTQSAVQDLLEDIDLKEGPWRDGGLYFAERENSLISIVPGNYIDRHLSDLGEYIRENRHLCVITASERNRDELDTLLDRFGGISFSITPPDILRKLQHFESLVSIQEDLEEEFQPRGEEVPKEILQKVQDNPHYLVSELAKYEKVDGTREERDRLEKLSNIAFCQIAQFPLKSLGMDETGNRVPDGLGFIFKEDGTRGPLVMLDSKSVSSSQRSFPKIGESEGPQYRKYLEIADDIAYEESIDEKLLVFISPDYNLGKIEDFLYELEKSDHDDFRVAVLNLSGLAALILIKQNLLYEAESELNKMGWQDILYSLFFNPEFDSELRSPIGIEIDSDKIFNHFASSIDAQGHRGDLIDRVQDKFIEYTPSER